MKKKDVYVSPQVEVIELENEGVIALSNMPSEPWTRSSTRSGYSASSASSSDLEDLIEDILTTE